MAIISSVEPYATVAEANVILGTTEPWIGSTTEQKEQALSYGKMYIDLYFSCTLTNPVQDNVKEANALLANYHLTTPLFDSSTVSTEQSRKGLIKERVKADTVESEKQYDAGVALSKVDKYPDVTALLTYDGTCTFKGSTTKFVTRA